MRENFMFCIIVAIGHTGMDLAETLGELLGPDPDAPTLREPSCCRVLRSGVYWGSSCNDAKRCVLGDLSKVPVAMQDWHIKSNGYRCYQSIELRTNGYTPPSEFAVNRRGVKPVQFGKQGFELLGLQQPLRACNRVATCASHYF